MRRKPVSDRVSCRHLDCNFRHLVIACKRISARLAPPNFAVTRGGNGMTKKNLLMTILGAAVFCGSVTLAEEPAMNISKKNHPNLAQAQTLVVQAYSYVQAAR